jgi:hypothetical protein
MNERGLIKLIIRKWTVFRGSNIEVEAVKIGRRGDPDEVVIEVVPHSDGITICAVYPNSGWGFSNECSPGRKGRMNVRD